MDPIPYQIIRSSRKTISIQITRDAEVIVRCPRRTSAAFLKSFIEQKRPWIEAQLAKLAACPSLPPLTCQQLDNLRCQAKRVLPERVAYFAAKMDVPYGRITIRAQRSRWGSCSSRGDLSFNCLLMLAPEEVVDYVVVHELCHRLEMNHSQRFWARVQALLPCYAVQKKWLKDNGSALIGRLPK